MSTAEEFTKSSNLGKTIYFKCLSPKNSSPKAVICIIHGMGEHCNRYFNLENYFIPLNYAFIGFDHIGHGKSEGKRGHIDHYNELSEPIDLMIQECQSRFPQTPIILLGHSMGGNVLCHYLLTQDTSKIHAAIISSPWLRLSHPPSTALIGLVKWLHYFFPGFTQNTKLEINAISRDKDYVQNYYHDPLVHPYISFNFFWNIYQKGLWNIKYAHQLKTRVLWYHGDADRITSAKASIEFIQKVENKRLVQWHLLPDYYHETHNDIGKEQVYKIIEHYLNDVLGYNLLA